MTTQDASDISVYQGDTNYPVLAGKTSGVILRASIGVQEDLLFNEHWAGLQGQGHPTGAYHYFIPYLNGPYQAEAFLEVLGSRVPVIWKPGKGWVAGFVLDCEQNSGLTPSALAARIKAFVLTVKAEYPDWEVVIYTRGYWFNENIGTSEIAFFSALLLWVARYHPTATHPWDDNPYSPLRPLPWNQWALWQWSADGNNLGDEYGVSSDDIDLDRRRLAPVDPPPDPGCPELPLLKVLTNGLKVRSSPQVSNPYNANVVGTLATGVYLDAEDLAVESAARVWVRHGDGYGWSAVVYDGNQHMEGA